MFLKTLSDAPSGFKSLFLSQASLNFSFYGLKSIFIFFVVAQYQLSDSTAIALLATFMAVSFGSGILGGWVSDNFLGLRNTILIGSVFQTLGLCVLLTSWVEGFYVALSLISVGSGFMKPTLSTSVGALFEDAKDPRKDGAYSTFYIAMNIGGLLGPILLGILARAFPGYEVAISLSILVSLGLIVMSLKSLVHEQLIQVPEAAEGHRLKRVLTVGGVVCLSLFATFILFKYREFSGNLLVPIFLGSLIYFGSILHQATAEERRGILSGLPYIFLFTFFCILFEQEGNSLLIFFDRAVDREILGFTIPSSVLLALGPLYILVFGPFASKLSHYISEHASEPTGVLKIGIGFMLLATSFFVLSLSCKNAGVISPVWILMAIFAQTMGELCIVPVGASNISKQSPPRFRSTMMSFWLLAIAFGSYIAGSLAQFSLPSDATDVQGHDNYYEFFSNVSLIPAILGLLLLGYYCVRYQGWFRRKSMVMGRGSQ